MKIQATAEMLIRAKRSDVFRAFVEPKWLCRFWLSRASAPLTKGTTAEWEFMVPGARDTVRASRFEQNRRLTLRWSDGSTSHLSFRQHARGIVHVTVTTSGFRGSDAASQAVGNAEGFAIVLCDLKALLETGKSGGMVRDRAALIATRE